MRWMVVAFPAILHARDPRREPPVRLGAGVVAAAAAAMIATTIVIAVATRSISVSLPCNLLHRKWAVQSTEMHIALS